MKNTTNLIGGEEGQNLIYQGSGNFWGHTRGNKIKSLADWEGVVDFFGFGIGGKHDTWDKKITVLTGLKTLRVKGNLQWEKKWGSNPYANGGPQPGAWMPTEWPK